MSQQQWMIEVLSDLKSFARKNGLMALAEQLDDTILLAAAETGGTPPPGGPCGAGGNDGEPDHALSGNLAAGE